MFCGFNSKMAESLASFSEELIKYGLEERSKNNKETIEQAIKREISDMTRFLLESKDITDSAKRLMTTGLVNYVIGFYINIISKDVQNSKEIIKKITNYFLEMDKKYYYELEGSLEDMKDLVKFLNEVKI